MHIRILGFSAEKGITPEQWLRHQCELGADIARLDCRVGLFRRMLPVKFHHKNIVSLARIKSCKYEIEI
jgi:hypothetical protein